MYSRFLVPLDGSPTSLLAIDYAADLARPEPRHRDLAACHRTDPAQHGFRARRGLHQGCPPALPRSRAGLADEAANQLRQDGIAVETVLLESGTERVSEQIARQVETSACDLVILGTHGRRGVDAAAAGQRRGAGGAYRDSSRDAGAPAAPRDVGPARSAAAV